MKVLYLIDTLNVGGTEQSIVQIAQRLNSFEPVICVLYPGTALKSACDASGVRSIFLDLPGKYSFARAIRGVSRVVREERPQLIHASLFRAEVVARMAGRVTGVPVVGSFVNDSYAPARQVACSRAHRLKLRGVQLLDAVTARWAVHFTANSEAIKASNTRALGVPAERVTVIHRGRDAGALLASSGSPQVPPGVPNGRPVVLNVARLLERKGQSELIRAFASVVAEYPAAKLLIAGEGAHRARLESEIEEQDLRGSVVLLGKRDDVAALLQYADVFAFPSHYEGMPGALIEAMLAGVPVVATDIPMHREALEHGISARLVQVGEVDALASGMLWMLRHREAAHAMAGRAREVALSRFTIERVTAQHEELYRALVESHGGSVAGASTGGDVAGEASWRHLRQRAVGGQ
jgi:glycosyltransferase involved in cell wall biosynthesis